MFLLVPLLACSTPTVTVEGQVVDVWGNGVAGATVVAEGVVERWQADPQGAFALTLDSVPARVSAAAGGYMRGSVATSAEGGASSPLRIALWPEPKAPGFYAVGQDARVDGGLIHLAARSVSILGSGDAATPALTMSEAAGTDPRTVPGGARSVPAGTTRFLHKSTLDPRAFRGVEVRLARLSEAPAATTARAASRSGPRPERSWTSVAPVEVKVEALPGKDCYLLEVPPLAEGVYAFHTGGVLERRGNEALATLPRERLLAWGFHVAGPAAP